MGGEGPDIFGISAGAPYLAYRDFEEDITSYAKEKYGDSWSDEYLDFCMNMLKDNDGGCYGIPLGLTYAGYAWADVKMLKEYGLEVPKSYSELLEASKALRDAGQLPLAIGAKDSWLNGDTFMNIASDVNADVLYKAIEGQASFEDPDMVKAFTIWQNAFNDGVFQDGAVGVSLYNDVNDMFQKEGSIPMMLNGSWAMNMYTIADSETQATFNTEGADHDIFLIDWNDDGKVSPVVAAVDVVLCMNKYSEKKEAAFKFMDYLTHAGQEMLVNDYLEYMPSLKNFNLNVKNLSEDGTKNLEYIVENGQNNVAGGRIIPYGDLYAKLLEVLEALAINDMKPEEAAAAMEEVSANLTR